ncbi:hypothetical protein IFM89_027254 [Coptis chinensis]|uniref:Phytocyanin domain-containing protein n=1 Tax=Coptis chinensis TaxID=261450 RepID=A0A835HEI8_9MAGN|nr:hypothetical protein IFM89_027254 [Coptis chinensis]
MTIIPVVTAAAINSLIQDLEIPSPVLDFPASASYCNHQFLTTLAMVCNTTNVPLFSCSFKWDYVISRGQSFAQRWLNAQCRSPCGHCELPRVGDEVGWTIRFDYAAWAKGKTFYVGDQLVFNYPVGVHNVFKVNGTSFKDCVVPPPNEALATGSDIITLVTPGRKWYICGVSQHCKLGGQKLFIAVQPKSMVPAPSPTVSETYTSPAPALAWR